MILNFMILNFLCSFIISVQADIISVAPPGIETELRIPITQAILFRASVEKVDAPEIQYTPVYSVSKTGYETGHSLMFKKAIDYLLYKNNSPAAHYPLEEYLKSLVYGSWYADNSGPKYDWVFYQGRGDQIHHYGEVGEIKFKSDWLRLFSLLSPCTLFDNGITVGHTGEYATPYYAQVLYDQALKFWPGGEKPSLSQLPVRYAGRAVTPFTSKVDYGKTCVGGYPLQPASSPRWPEWAATNDGYGTVVENSENAMKYLGWSIHLLQDVTVPHNAANYANLESEEFEGMVNSSARYLTDLPSGKLNFTVSNIEDLGKKVVEISKSRSTDPNPTNVRQQTDLAIQVTTAMIDRFFADLEKQSNLTEWPPIKKSKPCSFNPGISNSNCFKIDSSKI